MQNFRTCIAILIVKCKQIYPYLVTFMVFIIHFSGYLLDDAENMHTLVQLKIRIGQAYFKFCIKYAIVLKWCISCIVLNYSNATKYTTRVLLGTQHLSIDTENTSFLANSVNFLKYCLVQHLQYIHLGHSQSRPDGGEIECTLKS